MDLFHFFEAIIKEEEWRTFLSSEMKPHHLSCRPGMAIKEKALRTLSTETANSSAKVLGLLNRLSYTSNQGSCGMVVPAATVHWISRFLISIS